MKFRIHFTVNDIDDYFVAEGDTIENVRKNVDSEMIKRGLNEEENNLWSEEIQ